MSRAAFWRTYFLMLILVPMGIYWSCNRPAFEQNQCIMIKQQTSKSHFSGFCYGATLSPGLKDKSCDPDVKWCYYVTDITCFDSAQDRVILDTDGPSLLLGEDLIEVSSVCSTEKIVRLP